jgi:uncharacterized protein
MTLKTCDGRGCNLIVLSDTSPIRALHHLGLLHVLAPLFISVIIPPAVVTELAAQTRFPAIDLSLFPFLQVTVPQDQALVATLQQELDAGESEAIALAAELHADLLLIDERHGRHLATLRGIPTTGVLGVLVRAKAHGFVPSVRTLALRLRDELGFHLTDAVIEEASRLAGDS